MKIAACACHIGLTQKEKKRIFLPPLFFCVSHLWKEFFFFFSKKKQFAIMENDVERDRENEKMSRNKSCFADIFNFSQQLRGYALMINFIFIKKILLPWKRILN